ncbi:hypothetical protein DID76_02450 [Candidatus Marinamargulisbacteria bacterium SCGC AG-414-C22]|nr:hypothetical protein DID76_02450 [Candidatus Marinamargulisbacteria bacterium SCGC AG-414-C22]
MIQRHVTFNDVLFTQLIARVAARLHHFNESSDGIFAASFNNQDQSFAIQSHHLSSQELKEHAYPLFSLFNCEADLNTESSVKSFVSKLLGATAQSKHEKTMNRVPFDFILTARFKENLLYNPLKSYQELGKHSLKFFLEADMKHCQTVLRALLHFFKDHQYFDFDQLDYLGHRLLKQMSGSAVFSLNHMDDLVKTFYDFIEELTVVFSAVSVKDVDFTDDTFSEFVFDLKKGAQLCVQFVESISQLFSLCTIYKIHVYLLLCGTTSGLSSVHHDHLNEQTQRLFQSFFADGGVLPHFHQPLRALETVVLDLSVTVYGKKMSEKVSVSYKQLLQLKETLFSSYDNAQAQIYNLLCCYVDALFSQDDVDYVKLGERFFIDSFPHFQWEYMIDSVIALMKDKWTLLASFLKGLPESSYYLHDEKIVVSQEDLDRFYKHLVRFEATLFWINLVMFLSFKYMTFNFPKQFCVKCDVDFDRELHVSLSIHVFRLVCLYAQPAVVQQLSLGIAKSYSVENLRRCFAKTCYLPESGKVHTLFKSDVNWWNSVYFLEQWVMQSRHVILTMPEVCWNVFLADWTVQDLYYSDFLTTLLTYYKTHSQEKYLIDLLVYKINSDESVSHSYLKDDLLKMLYLKSVKYDFNHPILLQYEVYFSIYVDALQEQLTYILALKAKQESFYGVSLAHYIQQLYAEFIRISLTENDYVVLFLLHKVGFNHVLESLFLVYSCDETLFFDLFSFLAIYIQKSTTLKNTFMHYCRDHELTFKERPVLLKQFKTIFQEGHLYARESARIVMDILGVQLDNQVKTDYLVHYFPKDIIDVLGNAIFAIFQTAHTVLKNQKSTDKLEHQFKVRKLLANYEQHTYSYLGSALSTELATIYHFAEQDMLQFSDRLQSFSHTILHADDLVLTQKVLVYQWIFLLHFSYLDSADWVVMDALLFVPFYKKPHLFNQANMPVFSEQLLPLIIVSKDIQQVFDFFFLCLYDISVFSDRNFNVSLLISLLHHLKDFIDCRAGFTVNQLHSLHHIVSQLFDYLLKCLCDKTTAETYYGDEAVVLFTFYLDRALIQVDHPMASWITKEYEQNHANIEKSFQGFMNLLEQYNVVLMWSQSLFSDLASLDDAVLVQRLTVLVKSHSICRYFQLYHVNFLFKWVGVVLLRLQRLDHKKLQRLCYVFLDIVFPISTHEIVWEKQKLLREFSCDLFLNNQFLHFLKSFYFESSADERYQFFSLMSFFPEFLKQQLAHFYYKGQRVKNHYYQDKIMELIGRTLVDVLTDQEQQYSQWRVNVMTVLLHFETDVQQGQKNDLFLLEQEAKDCLNKLSSSLTISDSLVNIQRLLGVVTIDNPQTLTALADLDYTNEKDVLQALMFSCFYLNKFIENNSFDVTLRKSLKRSLLLLTHTWLDYYFKCLQPTQLSIEQQHDWVELLFSNNTVKEILLLLKQKCRFDLRFVFRLLELFSCDRSGKKDGLVLGLCTQFSLFTTFSITESSYVIYRAIQQGYSLFSLIEGISLLPDIDRFVADLAATDPALMIVLFNDEKMRALIDKDRYSQLCHDYPVYAELQQAVLPTFFQTTLAGDVALPWVQIRFGEFSTENFNLSEQEFRIFSQFLYELFLRKDDILPSLLTYVYHVKPAIFWTILLDDRLELVHYFVTFLCGAAASSVRVNDIVFSEWIHHPCMKPYLEKRLALIKLNKLDLKCHPAHFSCLVTFDSDILQLLNVYVFGDVLYYHYHFDFLEPFLDGIQLYLKPLVNFVYLDVFDNQSLTRDCRYEWVVCLSYLTKQDFFDFLHYFKDYSSMDEHVLINTLISAFLGVKLDYRLYELNDFFMMYLHMLDRREGVNVQLDGLHANIVFSQLCYSSHLSFTDMLTSLKALSFFPATLAKTYLSYLSHALADESSHKYMLDLAVNHTELCSSLVLSEQFLTSLQHAVFYNHFDEDSALFHQLQVLISQLDFYQSLVFIFNYCKHLLFDNQRFQLKQLLYSYVKHQATFELAEDMTYVTVQKTIFELINVPVIKVSVSDSFLTQAIKNLFNKNVRDDQCHELVSDFMTALTSTHHDAQQYDYLKSQLKGFCFDIKQRQSIYQFLNYQYSLWDWSVFALFIDGWVGEDSLFDTLGLVAKGANESFYLNDLYYFMSYRILELKPQQLSKEDCHCVLEISAFLLCKLGQHDLLLDWVRQCLVDYPHFDNVHVLSLFFKIGSLSDECLFNLCEPVLLQFDASLYFLFLDQIYDHSLFIDFWLLFCKQFEHNVMLAKLANEQDESHQFLQRIIMTYVSRGDDRFFTLCEVHEQLQLPLDLFFLGVYRACFLTIDKQDYHYTNLNESAFTLFVRRAIETEEKQFLICFYRLIEQYLIPQQISLSWYTSDIYSYFKCDLANVLGSGLNKKIVKRYYKALVNAGFCDESGYMLQSLDITKDQLKIILGVQSWTDSEEQFYLYIRDYWTTVLQQRSFFLNLLVEHCPSYVVGEQRDDIAVAEMLLQTDRFNSNSLLAHTVQQVTVDSSHKFILNDFVRYLYGHDILMNHFYVLMKSLSHDKVLQLLLDPVLSVLVRDAICDGILIYDHAVDVDLRSKKWTHIILNSILKELKEVWSAPVHETQAITHLEVLLYFFIHYPAELLDIFTDSFGDIKDYFFFDFHSLYAARNRFQVHWDVLQLDYDLSFDLLQHTASAMLKEGFLLFEILFSYRSMSFYNGVTYQLFCTNIAEQRGVVGTDHFSDMDRTFYNYLFYALPQVGHAVIERDFWNSIDYGLQLRQFLESEQLITRSGTCHIYRYDDFVAYYNIETIYLKIVDQGAGYYEKLRADKVFCASESERYFRHFFSQLADGVFMKKLPFCAQLLLLRRLDVEFGFFPHLEQHTDDFICFSQHLAAVDYDYLSGESAQLYFISLFKGAPYYLSKQFQVHAIGNWVDHFAIVVKAADFTSFDINKRDADAFISFLQSIHYLDKDQRLGKYSEKDVYVDNSRWDFRQSEFLFTCFYDIVKQKRMLLKTMIVMQVYVYQCLYDEQCLFKQTFIHLNTLLDDTYWSCLNLILEQKCLAGNTIMSRLIKRLNACGVDVDDLADQSVFAHIASELESDLMKQQLQLAALFEDGEVVDNITHDGVVNLLESLSTI